MDGSIQKYMAFVKTVEWKFYKGSGTVELFPVRDQPNDQ